MSRNASVFQNPSRCRRAQMAYLKNLRPRHHMRPVHRAPMTKVVDVGGKFD